MIRSILTKTIAFSLLFVMVAGIGKGVFAIEEEPERPERLQTVVDIVDGQDELSEFSDYLVEGDMDQILRDEGPFTVIAPTNQAFAELPEDLVQAVEGDPQELQQLLSNHLFQGAHDAEEMQMHLPEDVTVVDEIQADNGVVLIVEDVVTAM